MVKGSFYIKLFLILFLLNNILFPQTADSISQKNTELSRIKNEITRLETELRSKTKSERESLQTLENINRQKLLLNRLVNNLISEERTKSKEIEETERVIASVESRIKILKEKYGDYRFSDFC